MSDRSVRWGLISTARINERIIPAIRATPRAELVAVASQGGREKARDYAATWNIPKVFGSYAELLADREIDAVYISVPNNLHRDLTVAAAQAEKHITGALFDRQSGKRRHARGLVCVSYRGRPCSTREIALFAQSNPKRKL